MQLWPISNRWSCRSCTVQPPTGMIRLKRLQDDDLVEGGCRKLEPVASERKRIEFKSCSARSYKDISVCWIMRRFWNTARHDVTCCWPSPKPPMALVLGVPPYPWVTILTRRVQLDYRIGATPCALDACPCFARVFDSLYKPSYLTAARPWTMEFSGGFNSLWIQ